MKIWWLLFLAGCASAPKQQITITGPGVAKELTEQEAEDADCVVCDAVAKDDNWGELTRCHPCGEARPR